MKASKFLSLLLLVAMCLSMASVTALAEGNVAAVKNGSGTEEKGSLSAAINDAQDGDTVVLLQDITLEAGIVIDKDITLDLNGKTLVFTGGSAEEAAILVKGAEVTIRNGTVKTDEGADYAVAFKAADGADLTLDNMTVRYTCSGGAMLSGGVITVYEGSYSQDPSAYLPGGYVANEEDGVFVVTEKVTVEPETPETPDEKPEDPKVEPVTTPEGDTKSPDSAGTVTNTDGSAAGLLTYYKQSTGLGGDKSYKVSPELTKVVVDGKELTFTFTPANSEKPEEGGTLVIGESVNKAVLDNLTAGAYEVELQFKDATPAKLNLNVYMNASFDTKEHIKGSGKVINVTVTDMPVNVIVSDSNNFSGAKTLTSGTDYTVTGNTLVLTAAALDALGSNDKIVTKYVGFTVDYNGTVMAAPYEIKILPPPSIDPTTVTWKKGVEKSFTVKPDVKSVSIDGSAVDSKNYTVSGNTLKFPKGTAIADLSWGEHTLTVETSSGPVTAKITIEPSLGYSSNTGNQHAKGSSKTLIFIASDPIKTIKVNGTEVSSENFTLSADKKTVTLKAAYLNTLKANETYNITATVTAGGKDTDVSSTFKITPGGSSSSGGSGSSSGSSPQTGDSSPTLWVALLLLSGGAVAAILPRLRRE